jgi:DNA-binding NarL/FixJ family response regulator
MSDQPEHDAASEPGGEAAPEPGAAAARIRVAVVDDHPVLRDGIASLLAGQPDLEVVARGETVDDARAILQSADVDVLVLDVRLGTSSGLNALQQRAAEAKPAVVVLTAYAYPQYAQAALRLGASGFVLKNAPIGELLGAIRTAAGGGLSFGVRPGEPVALTAREFDVVRLVVEGRSNDEIAAELGIASKTVETHLRRVFERLDVGSRTELATRALREGWLELPVEGPAAPG